MATQITYASHTLEPRCDSLEARLRSFRRSELASRQRPGHSRICLDLLTRLTPMALGYTGTLLLHYPYNLPAVLLFAVATVSMLGSWFHDAVHRNIGAHKAGATILQRIAAAPVGFSPKLWSYKHVRLHHRYVSNPEFDPDIQFGYLGRVSAAQDWHPLHTTQYIHMWFLLPFATLNMLKPSELWTVRRYQRYSGIGSPPPGWIFLADKYPLLILVWLPVLLTQGPKGGLLTFVIFQMIAGALVSVVTQVQHNTTLADDSTEYSQRWPLCEQLARTIDVHSSYGIWWWLSGGTNFHVIHHLVPSLSFLELPGATARLRTELEKVGVSYPKHDTLRAALWSHALLVRKLARRPI